MKIFIQVVFRILLPVFLINNVLYAQTIENPTDQDQAIEKPRHHFRGWFTSHPAAWRSLAAVSPSGDFVRMKDGSEYTVNSDDAYKTLNWRSTDIIILGFNCSPSSLYDFQLINITAQKFVSLPIYYQLPEAVQVKIVLKEDDDTLSTRKIVSFEEHVWDFEDSGPGIILDDGSAWMINIFDKKILKTWSLNDKVMIGTSLGGPLSKPNILINVNTLEFVWGDCFNPKFEG